MKSSTGQYKQGIEIGDGCYFELTWRTYLRSLVDLYLLDPKTVQQHRVDKIFKDYQLDQPEESCVEEADLERAIVQISERNNELQGKVQLGQDVVQVATPKWLRRKSYHLDDMLAIIRKLERFAEAHNGNLPPRPTVLIYTRSLPQLDRRNHLKPLVHEAVNIDALYRAVISEGKAQVSRMLDGMKTAASESLAKAGSSGAAARGLPRAGSTRMSVSAIESAGSAKTITARIAQKMQPQQKDGEETDMRYEEIYGLLMEAAEEVHLDRGRGTGVGANTADRDGDGDPDINYIRRSLRFDQVADVIRKLAIGSGASEVDIKKQTLLFLASFPASCFDTLDKEREKLEIFIPHPYDTKAIIGTEDDPVVRLRKAKVKIPVAASAVGSSPSLYGSGAGAWAVGAGVQEREVDMVELIGILNQDTWAMSKVKGGWKFTPGMRNDNNKEHPLLKPYLQLEKKDQDGNTKQGLEILRAAVCCGYVFTPPAPGAVLPRIVEPATGWEQYRSQLAPGYMPLHCVGASKMDDPVIRELVDLLARNAHDHWAKAKKHAGLLVSSVDLIPYECLSSEQKKSNLEAAETTLRLILACGWEIKPSQSNMATGFFQKSWKQIKGLIPN
eukprot:tig00000382_g24562.t1